MCAAHDDDPAKLEQAGHIAHAWMERVREDDRPDIMELAEQLFEELEQLFPERFIDEEVEPEAWAPTTVRWLRAGDAIRMPGMPETERTVLSTSGLYTADSQWHVHPAADPYHPERSPAKWSEVRVVFEGTELGTPFSFKPDMPVEILITPTELRAIEALGGWENRIS